MCDDSFQRQHATIGNFGLGSEHPNAAKVEFLNRRLKVAKATMKAPVPENQTDFSEQIRARAYQFYEERGRTDGYDMEDWLRAEAEMREYANQAAA
ncbi:MAG TPA: DUF2934 domain-containing protein [Terriglobales bacterium]|nr:DUF2934 domain-containing protein [Terriglobales bacterium]